MTNTGSSPALRIACPVCGAHPNEYCKRKDGSVQVIAHKRRRDAEFADATEGTKRTLYPHLPGKGGAS